MRSITLALLLMVYFLGAAQLSAADQPNVVLILADDLGWSDLGCYGAHFHESPRLDLLAMQGLRFTNAYAMSVCSPTRATLLTGKHAARLRITIWAEGSQNGPTKRKLLQGDSRHDLPHTEVTLARHLQSAGYVTALVGKWHLGDDLHAPETHGFSVNIGGTRWGAPQTFFWPYSGQGRYGQNEFRYVPHLEFGQPGEYLTDRLTDEALHVIDQAGDRPFFLYLAHHAPHTPIEAKPADIDYFEKKTADPMRHRNPVYAAMIKSFDESVGRVLDHLEKKNLAKNTIVIVTSDNGGYTGKDPDRPLKVTDNTPLRSGKGSLYEGGIRVPLIIRWPGTSLAGSECHEPVVLTDLFHTLTSACINLPTPPDADGQDLAPLVKQPSATLNRDALYFHYPHYYENTTPVGAIRAGDWKLLEYFEDGRKELYNLKDDPSEKKDLIKFSSCEPPPMAAKLSIKLQNWRNRVAAAMPTVNPDAK